jgi:chondroitin sulfate proteoglycan 4
VKHSGFHVSLTDGINSKSDQYWVNVTVKKLTLTLTKNSRLHVFPLLRQGITPKHLLSLTSDPGMPPRHIVYSLKTSPKLGRILTETSDGAPKEITSFSQREINESRIWYEHTKAFADLAANDSFIFDVSTEFAEPILNQVHDVTSYK